MRFRFLVALLVSGLGGLGGWGTRKARFYKPCTSPVSESEFDHTNRIPFLKFGFLVYIVSRSSSVKAIYQSLTYSMVASRKRLRRFLSLGMQGIERGQL